MYEQCDVPRGALLLRGVHRGIQKTLRDLPPTSEYVGNKSKGTLRFEALEVRSMWKIRKGTLRCEALEVCNWLREKIIDSG